MGRMIGCAAGGKAYRVLFDDSDQIVERRDVLCEELPVKKNAKILPMDNKPVRDKDGASDGGTVNEKSASSDNNEGYL